MSESSYNIEVVNLTAKNLRIGPGGGDGSGYRLPAFTVDNFGDTSGPEVVEINLWDLGRNGRRDLQLLLSSGSLYTGDPSVDPEEVDVAMIALGHRPISIDNTQLSMLSVSTIDLTNLHADEDVDNEDSDTFGRRRLIELLASGSIVCNDGSSVT